jgi:hypothetical protein
MSVRGNLPKKEEINSLDSGKKVREFYNRYYTEKFSFPVNQIDAMVGFFEKRGWDRSSATATTTILLQQSKLDNVNPFTLLDTLKGLNDLSISAVVAEILNYNREKISTIGYRRGDQEDTFEQRNIRA